MENTEAMKLSTGAQLTSHKPRVEPKKFTPESIFFLFGFVSWHKVHTVTQAGLKLMAFPVSAFCNGGITSMSLA